MFETFNLPGLWVAESANLSLFSVGQLTGLVCESGEGVTQCVPVLDGYVLSQGINKMYFAGRDITDLLIKLLNKAGYPLKTNAEREIARDIKEKLCYVSRDFEERKKNYMKRRYKMPNNSLIIVKDQSFGAPEILFHPEMCGRERRYCSKML